MVRAPAALTGCPAGEEMTTAEAGQALEETGMEAQASAVLANPKEMRTSQEHVEQTLRSSRGRSAAILEGE